MLQKAAKTLGHPKEAFADLSAPDGSFCPVLVSPLAGTTWKPRVLVEQGPGEVSLEPSLWLPGPDPSVQWPGRI